MNVRPTATPRIAAEPPPARCLDVTVADGGVQSRTPAPVPSTPVSTAPAPAAPDLAPTATAAPVSAAPEPSAPEARLADLPRPGVTATGYGPNGRRPRSAPAGLPGRLLDVTG